MRAEFIETLKKAEELLSEEELNRFFERVKWEVEREEKARAKTFETKIPDLLSFLKKDIALSAREGEIIASSEGYILKIPVPSKPSLKLTPDDGGVSFTVKDEDLALAVREVAFAAESDRNLRPTLCGIFFEIAAGELRLTAADGYRLATTSIACKGLSLGNILVPKEVAKILPSLGYEIHLKGERVCFAQGSKGSITFRTIWGKFPDYRNLITNPSANRLKLPETRSLSSLLSKKGRKLRIVLLDGEVELILFANPPGRRFGENYVGADAELEEVGRLRLRAEVEGDGKVALNPNFLLDIVKITPDELRMAWDSPSAPIRIDTKRGLHLIMPIFGP